MVVDNIVVFAVVTSVVISDSVDVLIVVIVTVVFICLVVITGMNVVGPGTFVGALVVVRVVELEVVGNVVVLRLVVIVV